MDHKMYLISLSCFMILSEDGVHFFTSIYTFSARMSRSKVLCWNLYGLGIDQKLFLETVIET